jgi:hypothetical protein
MNKANPDEYLGSIQGAEFVNAALANIDRSEQFMRTRGLLAIWRRVYWEWNKAFRHLGGLQRAGQKGEYTNYWVNKFRNVITRYHTLITSVKADLETQATNSDYKSQVQVKLSQIILQYFLSQRNYQKCLDDCVLGAIKYGEYFIEQGWDEHAGQSLGPDPETGKEVFTGDIFFKIIPPWDMIRDSEARSYEDLNEWTVRDWVNKFEFAAKWPTHKDAILSTSAPHDDIYINQWFLRSDMTNNWIPVYRYYHKPTSLLPKGRMVIFIDKEIIFDGELPYKNVPIYRLAWGEVEQSPWAYSASFDMLQSQKIIDMVNSQATSNQANFGTQNIAAPKGSNINPLNLAGGLNWIEYDPNPAAANGGMPQGLNLTSTNPVAFTLLSLAGADLEQLMGMNPTAMGNPPPGKDSGKAIQSLIDTAYNFSQVLQSGRTRLIEDSGSGLIDIIKTYADIPGLIKIVGEFNKGLMREFAEDHLKLDNINRVIVKQGNPATNTSQGRIAFGNQLLELQLITPKQYLQIQQSGSLEPEIEGIEAENLLIKEENERLTNKEQVMAIVTEDHDLHIIGHKSVISNYENRMDLDILNATLAHIQEHLDLKAASASNPNIVQVQATSQQLLLGNQIAAQKAQIQTQQLNQQAEMELLTNPNIEQGNQNGNGNIQPEPVPAG